MFHDESWKLVYFWSKGQRSSSRGTKAGAGVVFCTLVSAGFC